LLQTMTAYALARKDFDGTVNITKEIEELSIVRRCLRDRQPIAIRMSGSHR
jgi:hypothetical protein